MMSPATLYLRAAESAARRVIASYSTSFGITTRLLAPFERGHVRNIYALVRVADEIVDGVGAAAGLSREAIRDRLDEYETETLRAVESGYSTDLIVHAFASTARRVGIDESLIRPFFQSMRADITETEYDTEGFSRYVYGSAEVVGLMCLRVFLDGHGMSDRQRERFEIGARALGAAFQKVNFLRDLAADARDLGRDYFPGVSATGMDDATKHRLLDDLDADLAAAAPTIRSLPPGSRTAVAAAYGLFAELARRIRSVPAEQLARSRIRVPGAAKAAVVLRVVAGRTP